MGLVAKLAGNKNAVVTLAHYTHEMRGGEGAVQVLDKAYGGGAWATPAFMATAENLVLKRELKRPSIKGFELGLRLYLKCLHTTGVKDIRKCT